MVNPKPRLNPYQRHLLCRRVREEHWSGILEAIGSLVQAAKRRERGYRTTENLIAIAYLVAGKLDFAAT